MRMAEAKNARARATEEVADDPELWFAGATPSPMSLKVNMEFSIAFSITPSPFVVTQLTNHSPETGTFEFDVA